MKKALIYLLLSVLLVVPLAAMVSVALMNRQGNEYSEEVFYNGDYSAVSTDAISGERIEEILSSSGVFETDEVTTVTCTKTGRSTVVMLASEGAYVHSGTVLCTIDGAEMLWSIREPSPD